MLKDLCASALIPTEVASMFRLKFGGYVRPLRPEPLEELASQLSDVDFCYAVLNKVSRSFAVVIQQLPRELQDPVCIFYLVLRGLDSVEDDMTFAVERKVPLLQSFHHKLYEVGWRIEGVGDSHDYRVLLAHFDKVLRVFASLDAKYQSVIADITARMGAGMADYATKTASIDTLDSYNLYCHYVAGLVGHGLSALFSASGLEDASLAGKHELSNSMGLFLQKTNIIRDYLEDLREGRTWWPQQIWGQYAPTLDSFAAAPTAASSLACLNHMVTDALALVPQCLEYLACLKDRKIFEFCAIPQVMAMATLELCYNNRDILRRTGVKIGKGLSCKLMLHADSIERVHGWFHAFAARLEARIDDSDPNAPLTRKYIAQTKALTERSVSRMTLGPQRLHGRRLRVAHGLAWATMLTSFGVLAYRVAQKASSSSFSSTTAAASSSSSLLSSRLARLSSLPAPSPLDAGLLVGGAASAGFLGGLFGFLYA